MCLTMHSVHVSVCLLYLGSQFSSYESAWLPVCSVCVCHCLSLWVKKKIVLPWCKDQLERSIDHSLQSPPALYLSLHPSVPLSVFTLSLHPGYCVDTKTHSTPLPGPAPLLFPLLVSLSSIPIDILKDRDRAFQYKASQQFVSMNNLRFLGVRH